MGGKITIAAEPKTRGNAKPPAPSNPLNSANFTASKQHGNVSNRMMPAGYET